MEGPTPATITPDALPVLTWSEVQTIVMLVNDTLDEMLHRVETSESVSIGSGAPDRLFDLDLGAVFDTAKHGTLTYEEALALAQGSENVSCSASCLDGLAHSNRTRCTLSVVKGALAVYDFQSGQIHMPASAEGEYDGSARVETAALGEALRKARPDLVDASLVAAAKAGAETDAFEEVVQDMLENLAYNRMDGTATRLDDRSGIWTGVALSTIKTEMSAHTLTWEGPKGGAKSLSPVSTWVAQEDRITISGTRFEPSKGRIFTDSTGTTYANGFFGFPEIDQTPDEEADSLMVDFLQHLVPDDDEREWLYQWIADKYRNPHHRNCAILFLAAETQGTGRGAFFNILKSLMDGYTQHVKEQMLLKGTFNEFADRNLMTFTNELGSLDYSSRKQGYEALKDIVDPTHSEVSINPKGKPAYRATTYVSTLLGANRKGDLVLDPADRRFAVILNGSKLTDNKPLLDRLKSVTGDDKDYTRLGASLARIVQDMPVTLELTDAPLFRGRDMVIGANETDLDEAIAKVVEEAPSWRAWIRSDFDKEVKLAMHGDTKARVAGLRNVITNLTGANAERVGAQLLDNKVLVASDAKGGFSSMSVLVKDEDYFMSCTPEGRRKILHGLQPDADDTNIVPLK